MKTMTLRNRMMGIVVLASAAAVLMLGLSDSRSHNDAARQTIISAHHATQVADGSESNGGKGGGKGGAKRSVFA